MLSEPTKIRYENSDTREGVCRTTSIHFTGFSSEIGTKLRELAVGQAGCSCYSRAALSSNDSKTLYSLSTNTNYSPCSAATFLKFGHLFSTERRRRWPWPDAVCIRAKCPSCRFKIFSAKRTLTSSKRETHPLSVGRSGGDSPHRPHSCVRALS